MPIQRINLYSVPRLNNQVEVNLDLESLAKWTHQASPIINRLEDFISKASAGPDPISGMTGNYGPLAFYSVSQGLVKSASQLGGVPADTVRHDGTNWIANHLLKNTGTQIQISDAAYTGSDGGPAGTKLTVNGSLQWIAVFTSSFTTGGFAVGCSTNAAHLQSGAISAGTAHSITGANDIRLRTNIFGGAVHIGSGNESPATYETHLKISSAGVQSYSGFISSLGNAGQTVGGFEDGLLVDDSLLPSGTVASVNCTVPSALLSVSGVPITSSGTIAITLGSRSANLAFLSPNGSSGTPSFRAIAHADLATGGGTGTKFLRDDMTFQTISGTGTVTSVALTMPSIFSVSGSPITTSGTLAITLATETVNTVFAGPTSGGAATPTFRALVAADIPFIAPRVSSTTSSSTPTPNADTTDVYILTALAANATFGAPTGSPSQGQSLVFRIKDNGTARTLSWNSVFRAIGVSLPTTTVINKTLYVGCFYNSTDTKWDVVSSAQEA